MVTPPFTVLFDKTRKVIKKLKTAKVEAAQAKDLKILEAIYAIEKTDILSVIEERLMELQQKDGFKKMEEDMKEHAKAYVQRPTPVPRLSKTLLGHKSGRITTHYSAAELHNLIEAANKVCNRFQQGPSLTLLWTNMEVSFINSNRRNFC